MIIDFYPPLSYLLSSHFLFALSSTREAPSSTREPFHRLQKISIPTGLGLHYTTKMQQTASEQPTLACEQLEGSDSGWKGQEWIMCKVSIANQLWSETMINRRVGVRQSLLQLSTATDFSTMPFVLSCIIFFIHQED